MQSTRIRGADEPHKGRRVARTRSAPTRRFLSLWAGLVSTLLLGAGSAGCSPTVKVEAPDKPIEINVNIKIEQEIRVKLDKAVEHTLEENPELFGTETRP